MREFFGVEDLRALCARETRAGSSENEFASAGDRERQALQTILAKQTVEFCYETVPAYRGRCLSKDVTPDAFRTLADLARFPLITRSDLEGNVRGFLSRAARPDYVKSTSGSAGRRLTIYGCAAEVEASRLLATALTPQSREGPTLALRVTPPVRRLHSPPIPGLGIVPVSVAYIPEEMPGMWLTHTDFVAELLSEDFLIGDAARKIGVLHVTPPYLIDRLTTALRNTGRDPADFGVHTIVLTGGHATRRHREICNEAWGAVCLVSYSCTEIGLAFPETDAAARAYSAMLGNYAEVVDPESGEEVQPGHKGMLALSAFYPFQQAMPLLRYLPGDVAIKGPGSGGRPTFWLLGRAGQCWEWEGAVLGIPAVLDALSRFEEIPQYPWPRFRMSSKKGGESLLLEVETGSVSETRVEELEESLAKAIVQESDCKIEVAVQACPKGSLKDFVQLYPSS